MSRTPVRPLRPTLFRAATWLAAAVVLAAAAPTVRAGEPTAPPSRPETGFAVAYDVYWLGFPIFSGTLSGALAKERYRIRSATHSRGVLGLFVDSVVRSAVWGRLDGAAPGGLRPQAYMSRTRWNELHRNVNVAYRPDGTVVAASAPEPQEDDWDYDRDPVPQRLRRGSLDPLTALAQMATRPFDAAPCAGTVPVFDGKRRYDVRFVPLGEEMLPAREGSDDPRAAHKCQANFEMLAGFDTAGRRGDEDYRPPKPTTVWLVRDREAGLWLPVKAETETRWCTVEAVLRSLPPPHPDLIEADAGR